MGNGAVAGKEGVDVTVPLSCGSPQGYRGKDVSVL